MRMGAGDEMVVMRAKYKTATKDPGTPGVLKMTIELVVAYDNGDGWLVLNLSHKFTNQEKSKQALLNLIQLSTVMASEECQTLLLGLDSHARIQDLSLDSIEEFLAHKPVVARWWPSWLLGSQGSCGSSLGPPLWCLFSTICLALSPSCSLVIWVLWSLLGPPLLVWAFKVLHMESCWAWLVQSKLYVGKHMEPRRPALKAMDQWDSVADQGKIFAHGLIPQLPRCRGTWTGFSVKAFSGIWPYFKLAVSSVVMLCLEIWYSQGLVLISGLLPNPTISLDSISICMNYLNWDMNCMLGLSAAASVRVSNELGAAHPNVAKFSVVVVNGTSILVSIVFSAIVLIFRVGLSKAFTSDSEVIAAVSHLTPLFASSVFLNGIQPILSGVAIGSGWQAVVAYVNLAAYYIIGLPIDCVLGFKTGLGVAVQKARAVDICR
ncbi:hypothetical protein Cgig2_027297 [Carnegiea gigantea]|uniref:Protein DETOXIFICATION n=1 Tax=Carnegiea gigantea TaxID=171969 RepID=A0A9Q1GMM7_9CARY|nr:hypothetical protein Cgig2_027297 [Carnegiea gigantea]